MKIRAYFGDMDKANEAINKLQNSGFNNSFFDANDHHLINTNVQTNLTSTSGATSLSDLVLHSARGGANEVSSPLEATSPMASGFGNFEEITDMNFTVTVDVNDKDFNKAKKIIKNMGGILDDSNLSHR